MIVPVHIYLLCGCLLLIRELPGFCSTTAHLWLLVDGHCTIKGLEPSGLANGPTCLHLHPNVGTQTSNINRVKNAVGT
jgi:hypothetical protein